MEDAGRVYRISSIVVVGALVDFSGVVLVGCKVLVIFCRLKLERGGSWMVYVSEKASFVMS